MYLPMLKIKVIFLLAAASAVFTVDKEPLTTCDFQ